MSKMRRTLRAACREASQPVPRVGSTRGPPDSESTSSLWRSARARHSCQLDWSASARSCSRGPTRCTRRRPRGRRRTRRPGPSARPTRRHARPPEGSRPRARAHRSPPCGKPAGPAVLESPTLSPYFQHTDMRRLIDHQTRFVAMITSSQCVGEHAVTRFTDQEKFDDEQRPPRLSVAFRAAGRYGAHSTGSFPGDSGRAERAASSFRA